MRKVGIVTLFDEFQWDNYGGRLQNFALIKTISKMGVSVNTIGFYKHRSLNKIIKLWLYHRCGIVFKGKHIKSIGIQKKRNNAFREFTNKYIPLKKYWINDNNDYNVIWEEYNTLIVGSDQVWNTDWAITEETKNQYLLIGATKEKRNSYAASFGRNICTQTELIKKELSEFNRISVREYQGKELLTSLIDKNVDVHLDPVFLITRDEWETLEKKPIWLNVSKPYYVCYFLGEMNCDEKEVIQETANKNNASVYYLCDPAYFNQYVLGPEEFIYMLHHAEGVLTDSFHATAFSIIFETPFLVVQRNDGMGDMSSRLLTLLNRFKLLSHYSTCISETIEFDKPRNVKDEINAECKRALRYLSEIIQS